MSLRNKSRFIAVIAALIVSQAFAYAAIQSHITGMLMSSISLFVFVFVSFALFTVLGEV